MPEAVQKKEVIYEFENFVLDPNERILLADGKPIHLTDKVFDTLLALVSRNGRLVTKDEMMASIWQETFVEEGNLAKNISRLRKVLSVDGAPLIETLPRRGYRFSADVRELDGDTTLLVRRNIRVRITQSEGEEESGTKQESDPDTTPSLTAARSPRLAWTVAAILLFTLVSGLGFYYWDSEKPVSKSAGGVIRLTDHPADDSYVKWMPDGRIRFFRMERDKTGRNMSMNPDGSGQAEIEVKYANTYFHWSPDGSKAIFSKPGDTATRYLANADGSNEIQLPAIGNTAWSSDSRSIVYQLVVGEPKNHELFVYSLESGTTKNVSMHPGFDADPSFSPGGSEIVFTSTRDGNAEIYLMNSDGSDVRRLTNHPAWENHPSFSPDGTTVAFTGDRDNESADVYLMNRDGSNVVRLTDSKFDETVGPGGWSPDGTRIAYFSDQNGNEDIYVTSAEVYKPQPVLADDDADLQMPSYSADGLKIAYQAVLSGRSGELRIYETEAKRTRTLAGTESSDLYPAFSPDGSQIAFQNKLGSDTEICLINADGSGLVNLSQNPARDVYPSFSPDGRRIAFVSNRGGSTAAFRLYLMNADGGEQQPVEHEAATVFSASWSPNGREIMVGADPDGGGNIEIYSISLDDEIDPRRLTRRPRWDNHPAFSPDGTQIAFVSNTDGNSEIYVMKSDGTALVRLTRDAGEDGFPRFSPDGRNVIFSSNRTGKYAIYTIQLAS